MTTYTFINEFVDGTISHPSGVFLSPDGTKLFALNYQFHYVKSYNLGVAWDVSTMVAVTTKTISTYSANPSGIFITPDGLTAYITSWGSRRVSKYTMSTAWDISTMAYVHNKVLSTSMSGEYPTGIWFSTDGSKMFVLGYSSYDDVFQYTLSTPWNVTTATLTYTYDVTLSPTQFSYLRGIWMSSDGTKFYILAEYYPRVAVGELATPWDFSTVSSFALDYTFDAANAYPYSGPFLKSDESAMVIFYDKDGTFYNTAFAYWLRGPAPVSYFWTNFKRQRELQ